MKVKALVLSVFAIALLAGCSTAVETEETTTDEGVVVEEAMMEETEAMMEEGEVVEEEGAMMEEGEEMMEEEI